MAGDGVVTGVPPAMPQTLPGMTADAAALGRAVREKLSYRWSAEPGLLGAMCRHALTSTGKLMRPILLLESALAVGGDCGQVMPAAIGAECGHIASLVHDDIIDQDELRRGVPSVQRQYGIGNAIVAGDAFVFDLFAGLAECRNTGVPDSRITWALEIVARCGIDLCRGQSMEEELSRTPVFDVELYLLMIRLKTAVFFAGVCACGAALAGGNPDHVEALTTYAEYIGTAFQIQDDLLAYTGCAYTMGKSETSDARNGRVTLPIILAHQSGSAMRRDTIESTLFGSGDPAVRRATLAEILDDSGALEASAEMARDHIGQARAALEVLPASASRDWLSSLGDLVIARER
jgi:geranylgeranyl pyrophosphate synthase